MKDRVESGEGRKIYEGRKRGLQKRKKQNVIRYKEDRAKEMSGHKRERESK